MTDLDWRPLRPDQGDWPSSNPTTQAGDTIPLIPGNYITSDNIRDVSSTKLRGIGIKVYASANQAIATSSATSVTFDTVVFNEGFAAPAATFTDVAVPFDGVYIVGLASEWGTFSDAGERQVSADINNVVVEGDRRDSANVSRSAVAFIRRLTAGDTVGKTVFQSSGSDLNIIGGEDNNSLTVVFLFPI
jgi:hypothetical protein